MAWIEVYGGQRSLAFELTTAIIDLDDPQRRWILWIIPKTGYFWNMIRGVSLLQIRKVVNTASGSTKQFWYIHQLFDYAAHICRHFFNPRRGQDNRFSPFYWSWKIAIHALRTSIALVHNDNKLLRNFARVSSKALRFQHIIILLLQDSSSFGPSKAAVSLN